MTRTLYMNLKAEPRSIGITVEGDIVLADLSSEIRVPFIATANTRGTEPVGWDTKIDVDISLYGDAITTWNDHLIEEAKRSVQQAIQDAGWLRFIFDNHRMDSPSAYVCCPTEPKTDTRLDTPEDDANEPL